MSRRTFRHPAERRTWSVEIDGAAIVLRMADDSEPGEELTRTRRCSSPADAQREAAELVAEQLADGFVELDPAPPPETPRAYFERMARAWAEHGSAWNAEAALATTLAWNDVFLAKVHQSIEALAAPGHDETREASVWLGMQLPLVAPALLLALRDPRHNVWHRALATFEAMPDAHRHALEAPLLAIIERLPAPGYPGAERSPAHLRAAFAVPLTDASIERLAALAVGTDPEVANNAALLLARYPHLSQRAVLAALRAWNRRSDLEPWVLAAVTVEHAVAELGVALHRDRRREATRTELDALIERALSQAP